MQTIGIVRDPLLHLHENGPGHPENPGRLRAIDEMLDRSAVKDRFVAVDARDATDEELSWVHEGPYLSRLAATRGVPFTALDPDTSANEHSWAAAVRAAGAVLCGVQAVAAGGHAAAVALVRPPGHHAEADRAMGFCLINNVAVACEFARRRLGRDRVLIVDWDVHHGNGTMHSFYDTDRVLFFSVHQYPHYPGTGRIEETGSGAGRGHTLNVPLPPGQGDEEYAAIFQQILVPVARQYRPQAILVSAGFDIARGDPLASMGITDRGFAFMTSVLRRLAEECCPGQLVFTLEGGYDPRALADGLSAVLRTLAGEPAADIEPGTIREGTRRAIESVRAAHGEFWSSLR
jgi:acetoin utilization deacetylase AcuC-like enzyme